MAAHINNTASQGASFTVGVVVGGGHEQEKGWGGEISGENKPFTALIESPSLAAARSCQEGVCLQRGLCGSHLPTVCLM